MRYFTAGLCLLGFFGCVHQPLPVQIPTAPAPIPLSAAPRPIQKIQAPIRTRLPYSFVWHGIDIIADSVERTSTQIQVTVSIEEVRGREVNLPISTVLRAKVEGHLIPYINYLRTGQSYESSSIHLAAKEKILVVIDYLLPTSMNAETPFLLQFPTGKWWSSEIIQGND